MTHPLSRRGVLAGLAATGAVALAGTPAHAHAHAHAEVTAKPSTDATRATEATDTGLPLAVVLLEVTPTAYSAADPERATIVVRARVEHRGSQALTGLTARLVAQRSATVARSALDTWARATDRASITRSSASSEDVVVGAGDLVPGAQTEVVLTLPAASLGNGVGAHLAAVEVSTDDGRVGIARTFLVSAASGVAATPLTLLLPLVAGRDATPSGLAAAVTDRLAPLVGGSPDPRVAWALDPALTVPVGQPGATGTPTADPTASSTPQPTAGEARVLSDWLEDLQAAAAGRTVLALPFGDPDLAALDRSTAGADLLARASAAGTGAFDDLALAGATVRTDLAWPADEAADDDLLAFCVSAGASTVVLDDSCLTPDPDLTYTPTGRADVELLDTSIAALVADRTMSSVLADLADPDLAVLVRQRLVAEAATTTLQRPSDPRAQLLVAPRSFAPDAAALAGLVTELEDSGWASWQPLIDLQDTPAAAVGRSGPTLATTSERAALPPGHVTAVLEALTDVDDFASALQTSEPDADLLFQQRAALVLLGVSWRGHGKELPAARTALASAVQSLTRGVSIAGGSVRNLAAERSELPITLVNELDVPVQVDLVLKPRTPRVQLDTVPRQTIPARSQLRVGVPVRALANGSVVVEAQLRTPAGSPIGDAVEVDLNVRADVENWISGVVGGGAAALLVVGVARAFRRGRRRVDQAEHADLEESPTSAPPGETAQARGREV